PARRVAAADLTALVVEERRWLGGRRSRQQHQRNRNGDHPHFALPPWPSPCFCTSCLSLVLRHCLQWLLETLAGHWRLHVDRSTRTSCSRSLPTSKSTEAAAIERVRKQHPAVYLKVCAHLVPRELQVEHSGGIKAMTTEQIERSIELIKEMLAERAAEANAKVIEGQSEAVPSLPAPVTHTKAS